MRSKNKRNVSFNHITILCRKEIILPSNSWGDFCAVRASSMAALNRQTRQARSGTDRINKYLVAQLTGVGQDDRDGSFIGRCAN